MLGGASVESVDAAAICIAPLPGSFRSVAGSKHDNALPLILLLLNEHLDGELRLELLQSGATLSDDTPHSGDRDGEAQLMRVRELPGSDDGVGRQLGARVGLVGCLSGYQQLEAELCESA